MQNGMTTVPAAPAPVMEKRERIKLERAAGDKNRLVANDALVIWYDARGIDEKSARAILPRLGHLPYTGVVFDEASLGFAPLAAPSLTTIVAVDNEAAWKNLSGKLQTKSPVVVASADAAFLATLEATGIKTCVCAYVDDGESLHESIRLGAESSYLSIRFRDPTNIPLELVIASLQATDTVLIKEIAPHDVDDAVVTLGVMEVGADGVTFSPRDQGLLDAFVGRIAALDHKPIKLQVGTVVSSAPIGMGYRSCIDLATLFSPTEGMLVGSTSQGGIFCCPEVYFLPYMELRPFRVNAGAVHSYVYNHRDRTDYMTELRAGSSVMIVDHTGKTRSAPVGRMKTEMRPLRLIEVEFEGGVRVNVIMQDDWHVRVFSHDAKPLNITDLKPGDRVLGHVASPGRHVGIKVDEHIIES